MLPIDLGLTLHTVAVSAVLLLIIIIIEAYAPEGPKEYIPKKQTPPPRESVDQSIRHRFQ